VIGEHRDALLCESLSGKYHPLRIFIIGPGVCTCLAIKIQLGTECIVGTMQILCNPITKQGISCREKIHGPNIDHFLSCMILLTEKFH
jgi:hypothetical protein